MGSLGLKDQFEWPLFTSNPYSPEDFALKMSTELGLSSEFIPTIAHAIREQVIHARINFEDAEQAPLFKDRPLRLTDTGDIWGPEVRVLSTDELDKISREKERSSR